MDWYEVGFRAFVALIVVIGATLVGIWAINRIKEPDWDGLHHREGEE